MRAGRVTAPGQIEIVDAPDPGTPPSGHCLVRVDYIGVCGSDVRRGFRPQAGATYPLPAGFPGHECLGTVLESNHENVHAGEVVLLHPTGLMGLQERVVIDASRLARVPAATSTDDPYRWLMCEPASTVLHALHRMPPLLGRRVAIIGQGTMGLTWTAIAHRLGARGLHVVDLEEHRLAVGRELGADGAVRLTDEEVEDPARYGDAGAFDVVVEVAGEVPAISAAIELVRREGLVVLFGTPNERMVELDYRTLRDREVETLCTAPGQGERIGSVMAEMVDLTARGWLDLSALVTHEVPFEDAVAGFRLADGREDGCVRPVLVL